MELNLFLILIGAILAINAVRNVIDEQAGDTKPKEKVKDE